MRFTNTTGKKPTIHLNKADTSLMTITWADGETTTSSASGDVSLAKPNDYAAIGDHTVTIECAGNWTLNQYFLNNDNNHNKCLLKIYLSNNITGIEVNAFYYLINLKHISIPNTVQGAIGDNAFRAAISLQAVIFPSGVTSIGGYCFYSNRGLQIIILPSTITALGVAWASSCSSLRSIILPDNVLTVHQITGSSLQFVHLPSGATSIVTQAFYDDAVLASPVIIPDGVTEIPAIVWVRCYCLTSVLIPFGVISIGADTFYQCYNVITYIILPTTPPSLANAAFSSINGACKKYVPDASLTAYQGATNWVTYANYFYPISELPEYDGTIFFQSNGGTAVKQIKGTVGAVATEPIAPTKAGFTFDGWYKEAGLTTAWNWATDVYPATNITLYAKWI